MRGVHVHTSGVPDNVRQSVADVMVAFARNREGNWEVSITNDSVNNAWDVEIEGPNHFHWTRRFSGEDRDSLVMSAAINAAVTTAPKVA